MNKDYIIKETDENTWEVIDTETGKTEHTITKEDIVDKCKIEYEEEKNNISEEYFIDCVWWWIDEKYTLELVDNYCQDWDKFCAWFDYVCVEYFANELIATYKQRLHHFE